MLWPGKYVTLRLYWVFKLTTFKWKFIAQVVAVLYFWCSQNCLASNIGAVQREHNMKITGQVTDGTETIKKERYFIFTAT